VRAAAVPIARLVRPWERAQVRRPSLPAAQLHLRSHPRHRRAPTTILARARMVRVVLFTTHNHLDAQI